MIDVFLIPAGKVAANSTQEICSRKSSMILTGCGQNSKQHCMEVLHENYPSSVILALPIGLPKPLGWVGSQRWKLLSGDCEHTVCIG